MLKYRLKEYINAAHYVGQPIDELPVWVREYEAYTELQGKAKIARTLVGNLLVPHADGVDVVRPGDWLVMSGKDIRKFTNKAFYELYEEVPFDGPRNGSAEHVLLGSEAAPTASH